MRDLIFIAQGTVKLYGFYENSDGDLQRMVIVRLREGSWYGDFQVLMDCDSSFELEAHKPIDVLSKLTKSEDAHSFIQVFKLKAESLVELASEDLTFRRFLILRATQRRAHFQKVFEETRHYNEINRKRQISKLGFYADIDAINLRDSVQYKHHVHDKDMTEDELESELTAHVNNNIIKVFR